MTGGTVLINGPTQNMNGALDDSGSFEISGGYLIAAGSAGMAMAPSSSSSQNAVMINATSALSAGTPIHIEDAGGETIVTFRPTKSYQSFVLSSGDLNTGVTYYVYTGGTAIGDSADGLYTSGAYTPGTRLGSFAVSSAVTVGGSTSRGPDSRGGGSPKGERSGA